ncbi:uncharacterized protein LOC126064391 [Elephas maximus indicus]|uniref:uncharacterized protein LOC126064391 n=1 Tax=Elephas maximus indicus TaxID=99487 RepID=UPI0021162A77|nr:uncharacterized protein LOC126064391 [Elephas maximus indicus]
MPVLFTVQRGRGGDSRGRPRQQQSSRSPEPAASAASPLPAGSGVRPPYLPSRPLRATSSQLLPPHVGRPLASPHLSPGHPASPHLGPNRPESPHLSPGSPASPHPSPDCPASPHPSPDCPASPHPRRASRVASPQPGQHNSVARFGPQKCGPTLGARPRPPEVSHAPRGSGSHAPSGGWIPRSSVMEGRRPGIRVLRKFPGRRQ